MGVYRTYAYLYANSRKNRGVKIWTWSNCYLHLMYAMAKAVPEVDLSTLTQEEIVMRFALPERKKGCGSWFTGGCGWVSEAG